MWNFVYVCFIGMFVFIVFFIVMFIIEVYGGVFLDLVYSCENLGIDGNLFFYLIVGMI